MTAAEDRDPFPVNEDRALDALTLAWGDSCEIYLAGGQWQAWHDDAPDQDMLTASTPRELNRAIRTDFARREAARTGTVSTSWPRPSVPAPPAAREGTVSARPAPDDRARDNRLSPGPPQDQAARASTKSRPAPPAHAGNLTSVVFRALYPDYALISIGVLHVVTPQGTPVFTGDSPGAIARQISARQYPSPARPPLPGTADPAAPEPGTIT